MLLTCDVNRLNELNKTDLVEQASVAIWLLINEAKAQNGKFVTSNLLNETYNDEILELQTLEMRPNCPTTLLSYKREINV